MAVMLEISEPSVLGVDSAGKSGMMLTAVATAAMEKRWAGRVAECSGLENRRRLVAFPGFESLAHRHFSSPDIPAHELCLSPFQDLS